MFNAKIISNNLSKLTKQEIKVANYAIEKGFEIVNISINEIVIKTQTSLATVNRTFAKLGFTGLKFYKMFLFSKINYKIDKNEKFNFGKDHLLLALENTLCSLDNQLIEKVAKLLISNCEKIIILGEGFSYYIGKIFQSKLTKLFFDVKMFDENLYNKFSKSTVLIIFSANMVNKSLIKKVSILKSINKKIKTIVFTTNSKIKHDSFYDYVLCSAFIDDYKMNNQELPSDSLILLLTLANIVFDQIYMENEIKNQKLIEKIKW